jgi:hypothetical protein
MHHLSDELHCALIFGTVYEYHKTGSTLTLN